MSRFFRDKPPAEPAPRDTSSVYEGRFIGDDDDGDRWVTVAEADTAHAPLRWARGWEQRAQGWIPFNEFFGDRW